MKSIGVALGAGGARGLAHIIVLEAFEELGIRPSVISGTSFGAIIGAGFAAGLSSSAMKEAVQEAQVLKGKRFWNGKKRNLPIAVTFLDPTTEAGGLIKGEKFVSFLRSKIRIGRFEDLQIPLYVIATNYWKREQVVLSQGDLYQALRASYSLPALFTPVKFGKELLVDGGLMNPLPYDIIKPLCDITIAIDVSVRETASKPNVRAQEILFSSYQIMQNSILREKLKQSQPDGLIQPDIQNVRMLEFNKINSIYQQAFSAKEELKRKLAQVLEIETKPLPFKKRFRWPWGK